MKTFRDTWEQMLQLPKAANKRTILGNLRNWFTKEDASYLYENIISGHLDNLKEQDRLFKINNYLYAINYDEVDYSVGEKYLLDHYNPGSCSSVRSGNFHGRNFDWKYNEQAEILVRVSNKNTKYKSIGVCSNLPDATKEAIEQGKDLNSYKAIPFKVVDGINEKGVCCNINVVPRGDKGITTGTHPNALKSFNQIMLPRYILDNFDTAKSAVEDIRDNVNVYAPTREDFPYEIHIMVSDKNETYIVEFVENECVITKTYGTDATYPSIMTNLYVTGVTPNSDCTLNINRDGNPNESGVTPNGSGLERHNVAANTITTAEDELTESEMITLMSESLKYTNAYTLEDSDFWYTEFVGSPIAEGSEVLTTCSSPISDYTYALGYAKSWYEHRDDDGRDERTWQTVHTSVYDLVNKKLTLINQETPENKIVIYL